MLRTLALSLMALSLSSCATVKKPIIFEITKDGQSSYVFGTAHAGVMLAEIPTWVRDRIDSANLVVTEIDINHSLAEKIKSGEMTQEELALLPVGTPDLQARIAPRVWADLVKYRGQVAVTQLQRFRPLLAMANYIEVRAGWYELPRTARVGLGELDDEISARANKRGITLGHLEEDPLSRGSCAYVIETALLEDFVVALLDGTLDPEESSKMQSAYRKGIEKDLSMDGVYRDEVDQCLFKVRHEAWAPMIEQSHRAFAPAFIAVGVAHLLHTKHSLIDELKQRGFTARRLEAAPR